MRHRWRVEGESLLQSLQLHLQCGVFPAQILGLKSSGTKIILSLDIIYICCASFKMILLLCLKKTCFLQKKWIANTFILEELKYIFHRIEIGVKCWFALSTVRNPANNNNFIVYIKIDVISDPSINLDLENCWDLEMHQQSDIFVLLSHGTNIPPRTAESSSSRRIVNNNNGVLFYFCLNPNFYSTQKLSFRCQL